MKLKKLIEKTKLNIKENIYIVGRDLSEHIINNLDYSTIKKQLPSIVYYEKSKILNYFLDDYKKDIIQDLNDINVSIYNLKLLDKFILDSDIGNINLEEDKINKMKFFFPKSFNFYKTIIFKIIFGTELNDYYITLKNPIKEREFAVYRIYGNRLVRESIDIVSEELPHLNRESLDFWIAVESVAVTLLRLNREKFKKKEK
ncbi:hypothetical protein ACPB8Q_01325 [Methanocaldococcus indicus]|uniref:hypothetical protein n=1 Tax=Methanocaldococcus indicus TaxID=213231 RepID=UPI003C6D36E3